MLIVTAKLPRRRAILAAAAALGCCALLCAALLISHRGAQTAAVGGRRIRTNEDRVEFLAEYGWIVKEDSFTAEELLVPKEFDESYDEYLSLQAEQGFDLAKYAGKRVKRYRYEILNYPDGRAGVQADLLICRDRVVGGEIWSAEGDGFLHGLAMPAPAPAISGAVLW